MFIVSHYILVWSAHIFMDKQVVYPIINGEVSVGGPHVGTFVVPNVSSLDDSMVVDQRLDKCE